MFHIFDFPVRIVEGAGSIENLGREAAGLGARSAMVVTGRVVGRTGLHDGAVDSLKKAGLEVAVYNEVKEDPDRADVARLTGAVKDAGADLVVAVGGGSTMCAAKGAAMVATNGGDIRDYKGIGKHKSAPMPVIAIPTTAGSGSEVSPKFVIIDEETNEKMTMGGTDCYPAVSILDPQLLVNLPFRQAVVSSLDALAHAVEGFVARGASVFTDALAWWAVDIIYNNIEKSSVPGGSLDSKALVLSASSIANIACGTAGLGLVHALQQGILESEQGHGAACGLLLPEVMEYNTPACLSKMAKLALAMGAPPGLPDQQAAETGIANLRALYDRLGFPGQIVAPNPWTMKLDDRVEKVFKYSMRLIEHNPREITREGAAEILRKVVG